MKITTESTVKNGAGIRKRLTALFLVLSICMSMFPVSVFADGYVTIETAVFEEPVLVETEPASEMISTDSDDFTEPVSEDIEAVSVEPYTADAPFETVTETSGDEADGVDVAEESDGVKESDKLEEPSVAEEIPAAGNLEQEPYQTEVVTAEEKSSEEFYAFSDEELCSILASVKISAEELQLSVGDEAVLQMLFSEVETESAEETIDNSVVETQDADIVEQPDMPAEYPETDAVEDISTVETEEFFDVASVLSDYPWQWISDDPSIASVDANGKVTALSPGFTIITASLEDLVMGVCFVEVAEPVTETDTQDQTCGETYTDPDIVPEFGSIPELIEEDTVSVDESVRFAVSDSAEDSYSLTLSVDSITAAGALLWYSFTTPAVVPQTYYLGLQIYKNGTLYSIVNTYSSNQVVSDATRYSFCFSNCKMNTEYSAIAYITYTDPSTISWDTALDSYAVVTSEEVVFTIPQAESQQISIPYTHAVPEEGNTNLVYSYTADSAVIVAITASSGTVGFYAANSDAKSLCNQTDLCRLSQGETLYITVSDSSGTFSLDYAEKVAVEAGVSEELSVSAHESRVFSLTVPESGFYQISQNHANRSIWYYSENISSYFSTGTVYLLADKTYYFSVSNYDQSNSLTIQFEKSTQTGYAVQFNSSKKGTMSIASQATVFNADDTVYVAASANSGYKAGDPLVMDSGSNTIPVTEVPMTKMVGSTTLTYNDSIVKFYRFSMPDSNVSVIPGFYAADKYSITKNVTNGSVTLTNCNNETIPEDGSVSGTLICFTLHPANGYIYDADSNPLKITAADGTDCSDLIKATNDNEIYFLMPESNITVSVDFTAAEVKNDNCLKFSCTDEFTVTVPEKHAWTSLSYSTDKVIWTDVTAGTAISSAKVSDPEEYVLYFRGKGNSAITGEIYEGSIVNYSWQITSTDCVSVSGNIMTLLDYENPNEVAMAPCCFAYMFSHCSALISAPELPATTLAEWCYEGMFQNCTALAVAPELPVATLATGCYNNMFNGCTDLYVTETCPGSNEYITWTFPSTDAAEWNTDMLTDTSGTATYVELGKTYYVVAAGELPKEAELTVVNENDTVIAVVQEDGSEVYKTAGLSIDGLVEGDSVLVDGVLYTAGANGLLEIPVSSRTATVFTYNTASTDPHGQYPTGMKVYSIVLDTAGNLSATQISALDDVLRYCGASIRCTGNQGMRIEYGVDTNTFSSLTSDSGYNGYTLEELGTVATWAASNRNPVLDCSGSMSAFAYNRDRNYSDQLMKEDDTGEETNNDLWQYTNAFVFSNMDRTEPDLAIRPYMILRDIGTGREMTVYGGVVIRDIGYVALQNKQYFNAGEDGYNFIWDIIEYVYKDMNREDDTSETLVSSGSCGEQLTWKLDSEGTLTVSGSGDMADYSEDDPAPWYDYNESIQALVLSEGIAHIGNYAFYKCEYLSDELIIPEGVTSIGNYAFCRCGRFIVLSLPNSVISIGDYAFDSCFMDGVLMLPEGITSIGDYAFSGSSFDGHLVIPSSCTFIGNFSFQCFHGHQIGDISIEILNPNVSIGDLAFPSISIICGELLSTAFEYATVYNCPFMDIATGSTTCGACGAGGIGLNLAWVLDNAGTLTIMGSGDMADYSEYSSAPWCAYTNSINTIILPEGLTSIGDYAFYGCSGVSSIDIPMSVTSIGNYAFAFCSSLSGPLTLLEGIVSIGDYAFYFCSVAQVDIPYSCGTIGAYAFDGFSQIGADFMIPPNVTSIGDHAIPSSYTILGYTDSTAYEYAVANGNPFTNLSDNPGSGDPIDFPEIDIPDTEV